MLLCIYNVKGFGYEPKPLYKHGDLVPCMHKGVKTVGRITRLKRGKEEGGVHTLEIDLDQVSVEQLVEALDTCGLNRSHGVLGTL